MRNMVLILISVVLTACATPPQWVSDYFNAQDPCQKTQTPGYCGAGNNRIWVYNTNNQRAGYIRP